MAASLTFMNGSSKRPTQVKQEPGSFGKAKKAKPYTYACSQAARAKLGCICECSQDLRGRLCDAHSQGTLSVFAGHSALTLPAVHMRFFKETKRLGKTIDVEKIMAYLQAHGNPLSKRPKLLKHSPLCSCRGRSSSWTCDQGVFWLFASVRDAKAFVAGLSGAEHIPYELNLLPSNRTSFQWFSPMHHEVRSNPPVARASASAPVTKALAPLVVGRSTSAPSSTSESSSSYGSPVRARHCGPLIVPAGHCGPRIVPAPSSAPAPKVCTSPVAARVGTCAAQSPMVTHTQDELHAQGPCFFELEQAASSTPFRFPDVPDKPVEAEQVPQSKYPVIGAQWRDNESYSSRTSISDPSDESYLTDMSDTEQLDMSFWPDAIVGNAFDVLS